MPALRPILQVLPYQRLSPELFSDLAATHSPGLPGGNPILDGLDDAKQFGADCSLENYVLFLMSYLL